MIQRPIDTFVALTSKHGVFNSEIIHQFRLDDNMVQTLEELCHIVADTMKPNIEYLGHELVDHRVKYPSSYVQMYDSDIYCVEFKFKITGYDKATKVETVTYKKMVYEIPRLVNGEFYYIKGNRFYPIYHLQDATTYHKDDTAHKEDSVALKTLTIPIKLTRSAHTIIDVNGTQYNSFIFYTDMQKKKVNFLVFFFANIGFFTTIRFFEGPKPIITVVSEDRVGKDEKCTYFMISKGIYLCVQTAILTSSINTRSIIAGILEACPKRVSINEIRSAEYWRYSVLSHYFTKQKATKNTKLDLFIESHKRLYDAMTKEAMRIFEEPKANIYEVMRWMFINFTKLLYRDNSSIYSKKIRLHEAPIALVVRRLLYKMQRVIHSRDRFKTPQKYEEILTLPYKWDLDPKNMKKLEQSSDILTKIIANSNNTKYADGVNDMTLFNVNLKWTLVAPSTTSARTAKSSSVSKSQRAVSPTFLGVISLNTSGAGDPGSTGCFVPWVKLYGSFFKPHNDSGVDEDVKEIAKNSK
jgi:hypothetical protein